VIETVAALDRTFFEGVGVVLAGFLIFWGSVFLLLSAIFGLRMGYLVSATGLFAFMLILSALWTFGAPGTPRYLGPKGELPQWRAVGVGLDLTSPTFPVIEEYPGGAWMSPDDAELTSEVEPATQAFREFLAEEANAELQQAQVEGEVAAEDFQITELRFTTSGDTDLAAASAFSGTGGREVVVFGIKDEGNEPLPSWLFLGASLVGFVAHLPFLDRAERKRKDVLTGGDQAPWRGPA
jgi:hypothetical protein